MNSEPIKFAEVKDKRLLKATPMEREKLMFGDNSYTLFDGLAFNTRGYFTSNEQNVRSYYMLNHRIRHLLFHQKIKFCSAILSLRFQSIYFCPVLQCNNVAYFARSFALIW